MTVLVALLVSEMFAN